MNSFQQLFVKPGPSSFIWLIGLHFFAIQLSFFCGKTLDNEVIVWLPNAVLLTALMRFELRSALMMGLLTFAINIASNLPSAPLLEAILLSSCNLLEVGLTWWIMKQLGASSHLRSLHDFSGFVIAGPFCGAFVSGLFGAAVIHGFGSSVPYLTLMRVWWFGDGLGLLMFAPILMLASCASEYNPSWRRIDVLVLAVIALQLVAMFVLREGRDGSLLLTPMLILPFAVLLAMRFNILWTALGVAAIALVTARMAATGLSPFGDPETSGSIVRTQEFILTLSVICLGIAIFRQTLRQSELALEEKVDARTAELADNLVYLKKMQAELIHSAKLASLGTLVAGVAHELNTPIGVIIMAVTTLKQHTLDLNTLICEKKIRRTALEAFCSNLVEEANLIERNVARTASLIASFKNISVDQKSEERRSFDLEQMINENLLTLLPVLKRQNLTLKIDIPAAIEFDSYPGPLGQVMSGLINNALLHAFAGRKQGQILIRARQASQQVLIEVIDNGVGVSDANAQRAFDPFFTTRMGTGSSGLGLYIANNIVTGILGGTIALESCLEQGTLLRLYLPQQAPDIGEISRQAASMAPPGEVDRRRGDTLPAIVQPGI